MASLIASPEFWAALISCIVAILTFLATWFESATSKLTDIKNDTTNLYEKIDEINKNLKSIADSLQKLTSLPDNLEQLNEYADSMSSDVHDLLVVTHALRK